MCTVTMTSQYVPIMPQFILRIPFTHLRKCTVYLLCPCGGMFTPDARTVISLTDGSTMSCDEAVTVHFYPC